MNIQKRLRMDLEQALLTYGNDIDYLILRDGTSIEIIDEFVQEKVEDNYDNYMYKEINQDGTLRGKESKKVLRKTVLQSSMMNNQDNLRNYNNNKNNNEKNVIVKISENNEYLQCANCFKFFNSKETEEETDNTSDPNNNENNNNNINTNNQFNNNFINQNHPNIPRQVIPPYQVYNQTNKKGNQPYAQPHPKYAQNNIRPYYPKNTNNQYPPQIPKGPQPQQQYYYNNQIPKGNPRMPYYNNDQNNPMFKSRKSGDDDFIQKNNVVNRYPGSAKKQRNTEINYEANYYEYPTSKYTNKNYFPHSSNKKQENNYYQNEIDEFQESEYYKY